MFTKALRVMGNFCQKRIDIQPDIFKNRGLTNTYNIQLSLPKNVLARLHPDVQYDYKVLF